MQSSEALRRTSMCLIHLECACCWPSEPRRCRKKLQELHPETWKSSVQLTCQLASRLMWRKTGIGPAKHAINPWCCIIITFWLDTSTHLQVPVSRWHNGSVASSLYCSGKELQHRHSNHVKPVESAVAESARWLSTRQRRLWMNTGMMDPKWELRTHNWLCSLEKYVNIIALFKDNTLCVLCSQLSTGGVGNCIQVCSRTRV